MPVVEELPQTHRFQKNRRERRKGQDDRMAPPMAGQLFDCDPSATTGEWLDLDADLLGEENRPYLALLSPRYLAEGRLAELQAEA